MKKFLIALFTLLNLLPLFSQEIMNSQNSSWQKVIPGKVIYEPQPTSYGFSLITDSKYLLSFSPSGTLLWDKPLKRTSNPIYSVLPGDFFAVVTNNGKRLCLLNPSGNEIWSIYLDTAITFSPFAGRDGRFFVRNENQLACYGINGIRKWLMETPLQSDLAPQELSDGSFVLFLKEPYQGRTKGLRISPFGEILEEIIFSGIATSAVTCSKGVLISFTNGLSGLFALEENKAKNKWILQNKNTSDNNANCFILAENKKDVIFITKQNANLTINYVDLEQGQITFSYQVSGITQVKKCIYNQQGVFITDSKTAVFYNHQGIEVWRGVFPAKSKSSSWDYYIYTPENYLIIFDSNWTANAYRTIQTLEDKTSTPEKLNYKSLYTIDSSLFDNALMPVRINQNFASREQLERLQEGNYGTYEQEWISYLLSGFTLRQNDLNSTKDNLGTKTNISVFQKDMAGYHLLLKQIPYYGIDSFTKFTADVISKEKDKSTLKTILSTLSQNGYDPDGEIIEAIYHLSRKTSEKDEAIITEICDAVYSICLFNGRPAFYAKGKEILSLFLYPKYGSKSRSYARTIFKKISDLGL